MKTTSVRARITPKLKNEAEKILFQLGLSTSEAIELFFHQIKLQQGIPFDVKIPNQTTIKTFDDADKGQEIYRCKDKDEMFSKLGI
jgi:DNA-damage-inducible protein J